MHNKQNSLERYDRQIRVFGVEGQKKLKNTSVLVAGAGGLGSIVSYYLVAMGIGKLILVDDGVVELSNLNRQILYTTADLGKYKVDVAAKKLKQLNPEVDVVGVRERITEENVHRLVKPVDIVIDALDNWETRLILNKACVELGKPLIHGGVRGFYGQVMVVIPGKTPCLQCIMPKPLRVKEVIPIVPSTVGVIGSLEVNEAIKIITGAATPILNKLVIYDGRSLTIEHIQVKRNPKCPVCSRLYNKEEST